MLIIYTHIFQFSFSKLYIPLEGAIAGVGLDISVEAGFELKNKAHFV